MKHFFYLRLLVLLAVIILIIPSCKKEGSNPENSTTIHPGDSVVLYPQKPRVEGALPFDIKLVRAMDPKLVPIPPPGMGFYRQYEDRSQAGSREIIAENWTIDSKWFYFKSVLTFPYVSNPELIKSAYLTLYSNRSPGEGNKVDANSGPNNAFYIRRIDMDWDVYHPQNVNSKSDIYDFGAVMDDQVLVPHTNLKQLDITVDVTALMKKMKNVSSSAFAMGFMIELQEHSKVLNTRIFYSYEYPSVANPDLNKIPRLVVNY